MPAAAPTGTTPRSPTGTAEHEIGRAGLQEDGEPSNAAVRWVVRGSRPPVDLREGNHTHQGGVPSLAPMSRGDAPLTRVVGASQVEGRTRAPFLGGGEEPGAKGGTRVRAPGGWLTEWVGRSAAAPMDS